MGRLVHQKGQDLLLEAFAQIQADFPDWNLIILGEGENRAALEKQISDLRLEGRAFLPGNYPSPFGVLSACDLFVFSSRYEGQGMALAEAMACGLPAVSFDCPSGPAHIIRHNVDGLLTPVADVPAFAAAMSELMRDSSRRAEMARRSVEIRQRFDRRAIADRWISLFEEVRAPAPLKA